MVRAIVLTGHGTNCELEMARACELAGAQADIVHVEDWIGGDVRLEDYQLLNLPGGFLDGDDLGAARAAANRFRLTEVRGTGRTLLEHVVAFHKRGGLILGVCNGFQLLVKLGLLPDPTAGHQQTTLTFNDSGKFEDRWVCLGIDHASPCVFTAGLQSVELPVRHGEGKLLVTDDAVLADIRARHLAPVHYVTPDTHEPTQTYPHNPNGAVDAMAGLCSPDGRILGIMPHPEAFLHRTHHPSWTRQQLPEEGEGLKLFRNAVQYIDSM